MTKDPVNHALAEDLQEFIKQMENTMAMGQGNLPHIVYRPMHKALRELDNMLTAITTTEDDDQKAIAIAKHDLDCQLVKPDHNPVQVSYFAQIYSQEFKRAVQNKRTRDKFKVIR